jgi:peptidoglycan/xylan/chitin deacetylase (PgdA/CDA1 family)
MDTGLSRIRSNLSKVKFRLGLNPEIEKSKDFIRYIPEPYKSVLLFYADFELAWAWRYSKTYLENKSEIKNIARRERENIPGILHLCDVYNIPITWATVGHLFLEECDKTNNLAHYELPRIPYMENEYWQYSKGDWFDDDPCSNYLESPEWYCPDLIKMILKSKVKHEIGCHTFSHIDCRDEICSKEVFENEINLCKNLANNFRINLKSFVHPGHTIGNLNSLPELGLTSYRTDFGNILGYPEIHNGKLWQIKGTMEFTYKKNWSINYNLKFYKKIVERAIKNNCVCVFWFHPSFDKKFLEEIFPDLLEFINEKRDEIYISTADKYVNWLNSNTTEI